MTLTGHDSSAHKDFALICCILSWRFTGLAPFTNLTLYNLEIKWISLVLFYYRYWFCVSLWYVNARPISSYPYTLASSSIIDTSLSKISLLTKVITMSFSWTNIAIVWLQQKSHSTIATWGRECDISYHQWHARFLKSTFAMRFLFNIIYDYRLLFLIFCTTYLMTSIITLLWFKNCYTTLIPYGGTSKLLGTGSSPWKLDFWQQTWKPLYTLILVRTVVVESPNTGFGLKIQPSLWQLYKMHIEHNDFDSNDLLRFWCFHLTTCN